jgi:hypothetical protein
MSSLHNQPVALHAPAMPEYHVYLFKCTILVFTGLMGSLETGDIAHRICWLRSGVDGLL